MTDLEVLASEAQAVDSLVRQESDPGAVVSAALLCLAVCMMSACANNRFGPYDLEPGSPEYWKVGCLGPVVESLDVNLVFIGSSQTYRQVVPQVLDAGLSTPDGLFRSLNLGLPGMSLAEAAEVLRWVAETDLAAPRAVVVELRDHRMRLPSDQVTTLRHTRWHSWRATRQALSLFLMSSRRDAPLDRVAVVGSHLEALLLRATAAGVGPLFLREVVAARSCVELESKRGYRSLEADLAAGDEDVRARAEAFRAWEPPALESPGAADPTRSAGPLPPAVEAILADMVETASRAGLDLHFVVPGPAWQPFRIWSSSSALLGEYRPVRFDQPARALRWHEQGLLFDQSHLTQGGAVEYSELLGAELRQILQPGGH